MRSNSFLFFILTGCNCSAPLMEIVEDCFIKYTTYLGRAYSIVSFPGIEMKDILSIERCFNVGITVFESEKKGHCQVNYSVVVSSSSSSSALVP